jgi:hypothetical protein
VLSSGEGFLKEKLQEISEIGGTKRTGNNFGKYLDILKRTGKSKK